MDLKATFFDVSGTLIDEACDRKAHEELVRRLMIAFNLDGDLEEVLAEFERSFEESYRAMASAESFRTLGEIHAQAFVSLLMGGVFAGSRALDAQIADHKIGQLSNSLHVEYAQAFPASIEILNLCRDLGYHVGIISDFDLRPLHQILEKAGFAALCDSVTCSEEVRQYKPSKILFATALQKAGCRADQAIHFGDRWERDVLGAREAGMLSCLIGNTGGRDPRPDYVVRDIGQVLDFVRDRHC
jgi:HAD superfamily hydrolase (TIGR01549 family)